MSPADPTCPNCRAPISPTARFCGACGKTIESGRTTDHLNSACRAGSPDAQSASLPPLPRGDLADCQVLW